MGHRLPPIACSLEVADYGRRWKEWQSLLESSMVERHQTGAGIRLTFQASARKELERLTAAERDCCGFANWVVTENDGLLVMDVSSEGFGVEAVRSLFN